MDKGEGQGQTVDGVLTLARGSHLEDFRKEGTAVG